MLETERLIIRLGTREDAKAFIEVRNSEFVLKYEAMEKADTEKLYREICANLVIERKSDHKVIGFIGIEDDMLRYGVSSKCLSYYLDYNETKKGYMSEALKKVISYLFAQGSEIVSARVFVGNEDSACLLKRLGFHQEGILRYAVKGYGGIIYDDQIFSLLKEEWNKKQNFLV